MRACVSVYCRILFISTSSCKPIHLCMRLLTLQLSYTCQICLHYSYTCIRVVYTVDKLGIIFVKQKQSYHKNETKKNCEVLGVGTKSLGKQTKKSSEL